MGGLNQAHLSPLTHSLFDGAASRTGAGEGAQCSTAPGQRDPGARLCPQRKCTWLWVGQVERSRAGDHGEIKTNRLGETHEIAFSDQAG